MKNEEFARRFSRTARAPAASPEWNIDFSKDHAVRWAADLPAADFEQILRRLAGIFGVTLLAKIEDSSVLPPDVAGLDASIDAAWEAVVVEGNEALRSVMDAEGRSPAETRHK